MHLPYTKLFLHNTHSIALTANGHIQVQDSLTGSVLHSTASSSELSEKVQKSGVIVGANIDENFKYLVTATSDKTLRVWEIPGLRVVSEREAPKKPTDICFTRDAQTILISDKFGDVHRYPLMVQDKPQDEKEASTSESKGAKSGAKRIADESLLLGHVSLLTTFLLSKDEKYIITADRDEHVRVSWYPEAYMIERYCLGHKKFVSALSIPSWDSSLLISGGGDPELKIWDWMEGKLLYQIPIADTVMPHVKVIRKKTRGGEGSDGEGGEETSKLSSRARRKNKKKETGKEIAGSEAGSEDSTENNADDMQVDQVNAFETKPETPAEERETGTDEKGQPPPAAPLLAIQKVSTLESGSNRFVVFSAHGATALFYCTFPDISCPSPSMKSVPLDQPVLDFIQWPNVDELWVTVDGTWSESNSSTSDDIKSFRVLKAVGSELVIDDESSHQSLLLSLNTTSRLEGSQESLKDVDLYSALLVLPKNAEVENNAMDDEAPLSEVAAGQISGKELGRLKSKMAVLARQAALSNKREQDEATNEDRDIKRQKSESETNAE